MKKAATTPTLGRWEREQSLTLGAAQPLAQARQLKS